MSASPAGRMGVLVRPAFRTRILLALLGCIVLVVGLTMVVVQVETSRQVARFEQHTAARAGEAFDQLEQLWQDQLADAGLRLGTSRRIQAAVAEGDLANLHDVLVDERAVAAIPDALVIIADPDGVPLATLLDREAPALAVDVPLEPWLARLLVATERVFGYEVVAGRLFVVHATVLMLFDQPLGLLLVGFPVGDDDARRLAEVIDAEMCFVVDGQCVAATPGVKGTHLEALLVQSAGGPGWTSERRSRTRWAIVPHRLSPAGRLDAARVMAVPLDPVLAPFERIRQVTSFVGMVAMLLAGLLSVLLSRGLTRPVERLVAATRRIASGEYDVQVPVASRDELGTLGAAFNNMAEGLLLKERYRGILDKVVSPEIATELLRGDIRLGGETREVTTLFADVRDFTALTEGMEPQDVVRRLNDYLGRATDAVEAEGGVVDKYVGDEVIALFGAPIARDDDPLRAVRAALAIQAAVADLNSDRAARGDAPIAVGVGINTGTAVAGNMGSVRRMNYTVIGESINLTARLCSAAGPGEILISESTYQLVRDRVAARQLTPLQLKGFSRDIPVYAVDGLRDGPTDADVRASASTLAALFAVMLGVSALPAQQPAEPPTLQFGLAGRVEIEGFLREP